jgi:tetratricopeptide (TPR) repeat protein
VRCTVCGHVFKVYAASGARAESWVLRQASGATFPFDRLGILQDWIAEGKVSEHDLIAKTGGEWKRLSDLAEMKPFFDAARGRQIRREVTQPVAAGFVRNSASDYAATIRQAPLGQIPAPAPRQSPPHVTAAYESAAAPRAPMARPAVASVPQATPTVRQAQVHIPVSIATAPTQPAIQSPVRVSAHETADTIQSFLPASQLPQAPAPFASPQVSEDAPTMIQVPTAAAVAPTMPGASAIRTGPARAHVAPFQPWQEGPEAPLPHQARPQSGAPAYAAEPDLSQVPAAGHDERWVRGRAVAASGPAWAESSQAAISQHREFEEDDPLPPRRRMGRWIALALVVLLVGGGFYLFMYQRELVEGLFGGLSGGPDEGRHQAFFIKGQESFLLDTDLAFRQADREFQKSLALVEGDATTLATLGAMYAIWSQYLRDAEIDARLDAAAQAAAEGQPDLREAERLEREAKEKFEEARRWAEQARDTGADLPAVLVALADVARLKGDLKEADTLLGRVAAAAPDPGAEYVKALVGIDRGRPTEEILGLLSQVARGEDLLRVLYRKARTLAAAGRNDEARRAIDRILALNRDHERTKSLAARIDAGLTVALRIDPAADSTREVAAHSPAGGARDGVLEAAEKPEPEKPAVVPAPAGGEGGGAVGGGNVESMLTRALRMQENGQAAQAIELFEAVLERQPGNIDAMSGIGYCHLDRGNKGQAISWFRRALGGGTGSYGPAIIGLAETYKAQGQKAEALKWYRRYLEVHPGGRDAALARSNVQRFEAELGPEAKAVGAEDVGTKPGSEAGDPATPVTPAEDKPVTPPAPVEDKPADKPATASPDPYSAEG